MSITLQTLYIAKRTKNRLLEQQLLTLKEFAIKSKAIHFEIFQCDEEENEFLLYEEWSSQTVRDTFLLTEGYKKFEENSKEYLHRKEVLNLM